MKKYLMSAVIAMAMVAAVPFAVAQPVNRVQAPGIIDSAGAAYANTEGQKNTYTYNVTNITVASAPSDFIVLRGSSTKTVRVSKIEVNGSATGAGQAVIQLVKRSTADTSGSSSSVTAVSNDSFLSAATAGVIRYITNPTLGTLVGTLASERLDFQSAATTVNANKIVWTWGDRPALMPVLRGIAQQIALSFGNATAPVGASLNVTIETTEE